MRFWMIGWLMMGCVRPLETHLDNLEKKGFDGGVYIRHAGRTVRSQAYGDAIRETSTPNTPDTLFSIGSITKQFTGAALVRAQQEGLLEVSDTLSDHFEGVPEELAGITLHQLATHQAGVAGALGDDEEVIDRSTYLERAFQAPLEKEPGQRFWYSNTGYSLLAAVLEERSGQEYEELLREWFFLPHGMEQTGYDGMDVEGLTVAHGYNGEVTMGPPIGLSYDRSGPFYNVTGNGELVSSVTDLERWVLALDGGEVFDQDGLNLVWGEHARTGPSSHYGYGWGLETRNGRRVVEHSGANGFFAAHVLWWPDDELLVVTWSNGEEAVPRLGWKLSRAVLQR